MWRVVTWLCAVVKTVPIGTNLGLVEGLWMLVSGHLQAALAATIRSSVRANAAHCRHRWGCLALPDRRLPAHEEPSALGYLWWQWWRWTRADGR